jgi:c-di-GMP-binding flagellar brake protein YcgR
MFWSEKIIGGLHLGDQVNLLYAGAGDIEPLGSGVQPRHQRPSQLDGQPAFSARIVTMFEDLDAIALALDPVQQRHLKLSQGDTVILEKPDAEGLWLYMATVRSKSGIRVELSWPYQSTRVERREFLRIKYHANTRYALANQTGEYHPATIQDLGGGGVRLDVQEDVHIGDRLVVEVPLEDEVLLMKTVVRKIFQNEAGNKSLGLEFVEIAPTSQDRILNFVFSQHLKMRREKIAAAEAAAVAATRSELLR